MAKFKSFVVVKRSSQITEKNSLIVKSKSIGITGLKSPIDTLWEFFWHKISCWVLWGLKCPKFGYETNLSKFSRHNLSLLRRSLPSYFLYISHFILLFFFFFHFSLLFLYLLSKNSLLIFSFHLLLLSVFNIFFFSFSLLSLDYIILSMLSTMFMYLK